MALRQKTPHVVVAFDTLADAMAFEIASKQYDIPGRVIPVPPEVDAGCGTAWSAPLGERAAVEAAIEQYSLDCAGVHEVNLY